MNTFRTADRKEWRQWLEEHFETEPDVWFVFPMKASGEESISYNDAVEEALCFGWIDSTIKPIDPLHRAQHFTPRRKGSLNRYSRPNIERLIWLESQGLIHPSIRPQVIEMIQKPYHFPEDIMSVLRSDPQVWENYLKTGDSYKRIRIAYIDDARSRPEEFEKRLQNFISKTREGKQIRGYGGVEKYYY